VRRGEERIMTDKSIVYNPRDMEILAQADRVVVRTYRGGSEWGEEQFLPFTSEEKVADVLERVWTAMAQMDLDQRRRLRIFIGGMIRGELGLCMVPGERVK
jgi:hypothetical protein